MEFLFVLLVVLAFSLFANDFIRKQGKKIHFITYLLAFIIISYELFLAKSVALPPFLRQLEYFLGKGIVSVALFIIVMYTGALDAKKTYTRKLLGVRYELSILASTLFLVHVLPQIFHFGKYIPMMKKSPTMSLIFHFIALTAIICLILIIPLWVTSYRVVRKKMKAKSWKKLHRLAYLIYGLIYFHVSAVFLCLPYKQIDKFIIYSIIFAGYLVLKIRKKLSLSKSSRN